MRRETQNILLVLLGGALLKISFTGAYLNYVKAAHQWLLIAGGAVMVLLALVSIARDLLDARAAQVAGHEGHSHASAGAWLLMLPVLAVFLVAPPALGADAVTRAGGNRPPVIDTSEVFPPLPPGDVIPLTLTEFSARAAWDKGNSLNDRKIQLTGFIAREGSVTYIARVTIGCCAADGFPLKARLDDNPDVATLPADTWINAVVTVKPNTSTRDNDFTPATTTHTLTQIPQPEDPYEH